MKLLSKQYDLAFLSSDFDNIRFEFFASDDSLYYLTCIACWCNTAAEVISSWRAIQSLVSAYYQPPGELAKWNIYLAFFCTESLSVWDKYVIQNDKYAVRKIVLDGLNEFPDLVKAESLLNNQLLGADLKLKDKDDQAKQKTVLSINCYVSGAPLDSTEESKKKRAEIIDNMIESLGEDENKKS
ncbi:ABC-three component system middle component 1 [Vreelandella alkaliphila]|uniref:ABC-three component system middle component 1 n=1 Tax=Vreelandella alkaliphila TaxID=272774 RepID=UPI003FD8F812